MSRLNFEHDNAKIPEIHYKIASSPHERKAAFSLVYDSYVRTGLIPANEHGLRVTQYHLQPDTQIFVAILRGTVICTVTLIPDSSYGLPIEEVFPTELAQIRDQGLQVGEVSCLADRRAKIERILPVFVELTRVMAQHSMRNGLDGFVIAVHPRHARFYRRLLGFRVVSDERTYPMVNDRPAIACVLDFEEARLEIPGCYERFFGKPVDDSQLQVRPWTPAERGLYEAAASCCPGCLAIPEI